MITGEFFWWFFWTNLSEIWMLLTVAQVLFFLGNFLLFLLFSFGKSWMLFRNTIRHTRQKTQRAFQKGSTARQVRELNKITFFKLFSRVTIRKIHFIFFKGEPDGDGVLLTTSGCTWPLMLAVRKGDCVDRRLSHSLGRGSGTDSMKLRFSSLMLLWWRIIPDWVLSRSCRCETTSWQTEVTGHGT